MLKPEWKIIITIIYIIVLFATNTWFGYGIIFGLLILTCAIAKFSLYDIIKTIKKVLPILILIAIINMFFIKGETIFSWSFITISKEGIDVAAKMLIRITFLIIGSSILLHVSTPLELAGGIEKLMKPLGRVKFPVHEFSMIMSISLRFIPILEEEMRKINMAQKSRGAKLDSKNIFIKLKYLKSVIIPLMISIFRRSDQIAVAMESRCYNVGM